MTSVRCNDTRGCQVIDSNDAATNSNDANLGPDCDDSYSSDCRSTIGKNLCDVKNVNIIRCAEAHCPGVETFK